MAELQVQCSAFAIVTDGPQQGCSPPKKIHHLVLTHKDTMCSEQCARNVRTKTTFVLNDDFIYFISVLLQTLTQERPTCTQAPWHLLRRKQNLSTAYCWTLCMCAPDGAKQVLVLPSWSTRNTYLQCIRAQAGRRHCSTLT